MQLRFSLTVLVFLAISAVTSAADPFAEGAVWTGERFVNSRKLPDWELKITKRTEAKFEGEMTIIRGKKDQDTYKVSGKATRNADGEITFKVEKSGFLEQTFQGRLKKGEILLNYVGVNEAGKQTSGTATLKPK